MFLRVRQGLVQEVDVQHGRERCRLELDSLVQVESTEAAWTRGVRALFSLFGSRCESCCSSASFRWVHSYSDSDSDRKPFEAPAFQDGCVGILSRSVVKRAAFQVFSSTWVKGCAAAPAAAPAAVAAEASRKKIYELPLSSSSTLSSSFSSSTSPSPSSSSSYSTPPPPPDLLHHPGDEGDPPRCRAPL